MVQERGRRVHALGAELGVLAIEQIFEQFRANVPVEKAVLELVLEAAQAAVAGRIAILWAGFHQVQRALEQLQAAIRQLAGEACSSWQRVVDKDFSLKAARPSGRKGGPGLGHEFARLDLQQLTCRLRQALADRPESDGR